MAKQKSVGPGEIVGPTVSLAAVGKLEEEGWFGKLSDDEKDTVREEDRQLAAVMQYVGRSRLAAAAHLSRIYDVLGPLKVFEKYIKRYHLKRRSAYRAIKSYKHAQQLPQSILNVAMARNMPLMGESEQAPFGVYTEAIKKLPPPSRLDEGKAAEYLDMLEAKRRELPKPVRAEAVPEVLGPQEPKDLLKECYRFVTIRYRRLPDHAKKAAWLKTLAGMLLQVGGQSGEVAIPVIAPPSDFKAVRGRPRTH